MPSDRPDIPTIGKLFVELSHKYHDWTDLILSVGMRTTFRGTPTRLDNPALRD
ncbi:MAG: hypothetical protein ABI351_01285 [Herbaspirillum sp.]